MNKKFANINVFKNKRGKYSWEIKFPDGRTIATLKDYKTAELAKKDAERYLIELKIIKEGMLRWKF